MAPLLAVTKSGDDRRAIGSGGCRSLGGGLGPRPIEFSSPMSRSYRHQYNTSPELSSWEGIVNVVMILPWILVYLV